MKVDAELRRMDKNGPFFKSGGVGAPELILKKNCLKRWMMKRKGTTRSVMGLTKRVGGRQGHGHIGN